MNEKAKTVHEVAKLTGITARTLHYYDKIGLLKPSIITEAKYHCFRKFSKIHLVKFKQISEHRVQVNAAAILIRQCD